MPEGGGDKEERMREIKFRIWNKEEKKMWPWTVINRNKIFALDSKLPHKEDWIAMPNHQDIVLMQFIGLLDKHGKEIYEGDRIQWEDDFGTEQFEDIRPVEAEIVFQNGAFRPIDELYTMGIEFEIIGNRFENLELSKAT